MALTPHASWCVSAKTWDDVLLRYVRFRRVKAWRGRTHRNDGSLNPNRLTATQAAALSQQLSGRLEFLRREKLLPERPDRLGNKALSRLVARFFPDRQFRTAPGWLKHLWRAILLNRDCYTCRYCGRTAWHVHRELGATIRFELDHRKARSRPVEVNDFNLRNAAVACRSCNVIKGQMEPARFLKELRSLGRAMHRSSLRRDG